MSDLNLPVCSVQYPSCGACGGDTDFDGDSFYCDECDLDYGNGEDGNTATYRDEEAKPCNDPCDNYWHGDNKINEGMTFQCVPCPLPTGHPSLHWTPCAATKIGQS